MRKFYVDIKAVLVLVEMMNCVGDEVKVCAVLTISNDQLFVSICNETPNVFSL